MRGGGNGGRELKTRAAGRGEQFFLGNNEYFWNGKDSLGDNRRGACYSNMRRQIWHKKATDCLTCLCASIFARLSFLLPKISCKSCLSCLKIFIPIYRNNPNAINHKFLIVKAFKKREAIFSPLFSKIETCDLSL